MQSVNGAQFLSITPLFISSNRFTASFSLALVIVIVPLATICASLYSHKPDLKIEILNLILLLVLQVPREPTFI